MIKIISKRKYKELLGKLEALESTTLGSLTYEQLISLHKMHRSKLLNIAERLERINKTYSIQKKHFGRNIGSYKKAVRNKKAKENKSK